MKKSIPFFILFFWIGLVHAQLPKMMMPMGHTSGINTIFFSPDGTRALTASKDQTAKLWDVQSGTLLADLEGHTGSVSFAVFSPDGKRIITASVDGHVKVWDGQDATLIKDIKGIYDNVSESFMTPDIFSPDGTKFVTFNKTYVNVFNTGSGAFLFEMHGSTRPIEAPYDMFWSAGFSPDGKNIITYSSLSRERIWDAKTGLLLQTIENDPQLPYNKENKSSFRDRKSVV